AKTLHEAGDLAAAIRELEVVLAENPRFVPALLHLGLAYQAAGQTPDAVRQWRDVLQVEPANRAAKMYLAMHGGPAG
ncbi:MAG: tetratricopeptide repeat protein, partial [Pseudomonadota bacterium]